MYEKIDKLKYARKYAFIFLIISTLILIYKYNFKPKFLFFKSHNRKIC